MSCKHDWVAFWKRVLKRPKTFLGPDMWMTSKEMENGRLKRGPRHVFKKRIQVGGMENVCPDL